MSSLHLLPERIGSAAENMASDFLLLQRYPEAGVCRFRHYGWHRPSLTFGYSQKLAWVREQLPDTQGWDLCRRPTGGGVVDHSNDWTYALVIPRGHPLEELRAVESYRCIHQAIRDALCALGVPAKLKEPDPSSLALGPGLCFEQAEIHDVIRSDNARKIAGAAQKRNKHGLLFQGYISRANAGEQLDWDAFQEDLLVRLGSALGAEPEQVPWPDYAEGELEALTEQYASEEWLAYR